MATAVELFGKNLRQLHEENLLSQSPKSAREIAEREADDWKICGFDPVIDEEDRVAPGRWPHLNERLIFPFSPPSPNTKTTELLEKNLTQMHDYQNRSPFARFEEAKNDTERKPHHRKRKEAVIARSQQQPKLL